MDSTTEFKWKAQLLSLFAVPPPTWDNDKPLNEWEGVDFAAAKVDIRYRDLDCEIDLSKLPAGIKEVWLSGNKLFGPIDFSELPSSLELLYLFSNRLTGTVQLDALPAGLKELYLNDNKLRGTVDISKLPQSLVELTLSNNDFTQVHGFSSISHNMSILQVSPSMLDNPLQLPEVPGLAIIDCSGKPMSSDPATGDANEIRWKQQLLSAFSRTPPSWVPSQDIQTWEGIDFQGLKIDLGNKRFPDSPLGGTMSLAKVPRDAVWFLVNGCELSGDVDLSDAPPNLEYLRLDNNAFTGTLDLSKLPRGLKSASLYWNYFAAPVSGLDDLPQFQDFTLSVDDIIFSDLKGLKVKGLWLYDEKTRTGGNPTCCD